MSVNRKNIYTSLEKFRNSKVIVCATSDRRNMEACIASDILPIFVNHLEAIGDTEKISLILYTRGGEIVVAWSLVNLIRNYCNDFEVIIPFHCHSAGTLICLGSDRIVMTRQASLSPIDPSVNGPMNPVVTIDGQQRNLPVSVEFINGYIEMAKTEMGISDQNALSKIFDILSNKVDPIVLGQVQKTRVLIQMLAKKLLIYQNIDITKHEDIIKFLCKDSGCHDYTIYRREAKEELGLNIEKPNEKFQNIINIIFNDLKSEMELDLSFEPQFLLAGCNSYKYSCHRVIVESMLKGKDIFLSEGKLDKQTINPQIQGNSPPDMIQPNLMPQTTIQDNRTFEGWKHI
ncbi:MAG: serine protease [Treponema sp.]|nr:serine protease [Treponema sp.]